MNKTPPADKVIRTYKKNIIKPEASSSSLSSSPTSSSGGLLMASIGTASTCSTTTSSSSNVIVIPKRKDSRGTPPSFSPRESSPRSGSLLNKQHNNINNSNNNLGRVNLPQPLIHKLQLLSASDQYIEERKQIIVLTNNLQEIARATQVFNRVHDCDISIKMNDILVVLRDYEDRVWCKNVSDNNKIGFVPRRCIRRIGKVSVESADQDMSLDSKLEMELFERAASAHAQVIASKTTSSITSSTATPTTNTTNIIPSNNNNMPISPPLSPVQSGLSSGSMDVEDQKYLEHAKILLSNLRISSLSDDNSNQNSNSDL